MTPSPHKTHPLRVGCRGAAIHPFLRLRTEARKKIAKIPVQTVAIGKKLCYNTGNTSFFTGGGREVIRLTGDCFR